MTCTFRNSIPRLYSSFTQYMKVQKASYFSNRIIGYSSIMLQDGLDIQELPVVIRRMDNSEFPFSSQCYSGERIRKVSVQDLNFQNYLQSCRTTEQVLKLLEVPSELVTAYSAAFALHRMCQLASHSSIDQHIDCFIRRAILRELCDTICKEIQTLDNKTISQLLNCFIQTKGIPVEYVDAVFTEGQKRIADGAFSMDELLYLLNLMSTVVNRHSVEVSKVIWMHITTNRPKEMNEANIGQLWHLAQFLGDDMKYTLKILSKSIQNYWWKLTTTDVCLISKTLLYQKYYSSQTMTLLGRWVISYMHKIKNDELSHVLALFDTFNFHDRNIIKALERMIPSRISNMPKTVVGQTMDYLKQQRYLSTPIMDAVARDFSRNSHEYDTRDALSCLRLFGYLSYMPKRSNVFFVAVENFLHKNFNTFSAPSIVELLASFTYLQVFPITFLKKVFTPLFIWKLQSVADLHIQQSAYKNFLNLQAAVKVELPQRSRINYVDRSSLGVSIGTISGNAFKVHLEIADILRELYPNIKLKEAEMPRYTAHFINYEIDGSENSSIINDISKKLAIIVSMPDHFCSNCQNLLGTYASKRRHLASLGYNIIEVNYEQMYWKNKKREEKIEYFKELINPHLKKK